MLSFDLPNPAATDALARRVAGARDRALVLYLEGQLGAGKTRFAQAFLRAVGITERVKSPTYSLVEAYPLPWCTAWHLDLYRIADPGELEWLGLDAMVEPDALLLVEWPENGHGALPAPDASLHLGPAGDGRQARFEAMTPRGRSVEQSLSAAGMAR